MTDRPNVALIASLDTKGEEARFLRDELHEAECGVTLIDIGMRGEPLVEPDISREEVVREGGGPSESYSELVLRMRDGLVKVVLKLYADGRLDGVLGIGGGVGTFIATAAMRALPFGVPKLMVSTIMSRDVSEYVDTSDITMMHSVVDLAGLNDYSRRLLSEAAWAMSAMVRRAKPLKDTGQPKVGISMFGYTTPCVERLKPMLRSRGYQPVVFHANGVGGSAMEEFVRQGMLDAVLDITLHELLDNMYGGFCGNVKPYRLEEAGRRGVPLVVAPGGLDCIVLRDLKGHEHEVSGRRYLKKDFRYVVRSSSEDLVKLARLIAGKLNAARGPVSVLIPLRGWSEVDHPGSELHDPGLIRLFVDELRSRLTSRIPIREVDAHINDEAFARLAVEELEALTGRP